MCRFATLIKSREPCYSNKKSNSFGWKFRVSSTCWLFLPTTILKKLVGLKESDLYFAIAVGLNKA